MKRILILFAHPALEKSRVHYRLANTIKSMPGVHLHDLYETYPDFLIDIDYEQQQLREYDIVLLQHPFYWYSSPSMLKEWQDLVLEYGFAYGENGTALQGKLITNVVSTGGSRLAYCQSGNNHFTMQQLLVPFEQTANLCGMRYLPPFVVHATQRLDNTGIDKHASHYRHTLERLQYETLPSDWLKSSSYLNDWPELPTPTTPNTHQTQA